MYRGEIDTLRAVAVFGVIFFHLDFLHTKGGFLGVDVFFVISGYLISRIIFEKINLNSFTFVEFFVRRIKRIFPLLFVVCISTAFFSFVKFQPSEIEFLGITLASVSIFMSNILFYSQVSYFNETASQSPLLHTWSLSIEEQFYLVFPIVTFVLITKFSKSTFLFILIIISILSLITAEYYSILSLENIFFLTQFRIFELSIGVICSYFDFYYPKKLNIFFQKFPMLIKSLSLISFSMIIFSFFLLNDKSNLPGLLSLWATISAAIFILTIREFEALLVILNYKYFVTLGKMSYSLYLWHFPLIVFFPFFLKDLNLIFYFFVLIIISFLSWKFIELPFRNKNYKFKNVFIYYIIGTFIIFFIGSIFYFSQGLKESYVKRLKINEENLFSAVQIARKNKNINFENADCKFTFENTNKKFISKVNLCLKKHKKFILIIGDSHAVDLFSSIAYYSSHPFIISLAQGGCRPGLVNKSKKCHYQNSINFVHFYKNSIKTIVFNQKGSYFLTNYKELPILKNIINNTKFYLTFLETDNKLPVYWFGPHAEPNVDLKSSVSYLQSLLVDNKKIKELEIKGIHNLDQYLIQNLKQSNIKYISQLKLVNYDYSKDFFVNNNITYSDTDHWSEFGEKYFGKRLFMNEEIKKILN